MLTHKGVSTSETLILVCVKKRTGSHKQEQSICGLRFYVCWCEKFKRGKCTETLDRHWSREPNIKLVLHTWTPKHFHTSNFCFCPNLPLSVCVWVQMFLLLSYFSLLIGVPGEGNGVIGNLFDVADGVETLLVVSCNNKQIYSYC